VVITALFLYFTGNITQSMMCH